MDDKDREKIEKIITDRKRAHSSFLNKSKVYRGKSTLFRTFH